MKPSRMRENLIEFAEQARMSRVLVTLKDDAPLPEPLEDFLLKEIPEAPLRTFLEHHGFASLLKKLGGETVARPDHQTMKMLRQEAKPVSSAPAAEPETQTFDRDQYACVQTVEALDNWIAEAHAAGSIAVDTETDALESMAAGLVGFRRRDVGVG